VRCAGVPMSPRALVAWSGWMPSRPALRWFLYAASTGLLWGLVSAFVFDEDLGRAAGSGVFFGVLFATIGVWRETHPLRRRRRR
jgi:hypothetical protein